MAEPRNETQLVAAITRAVKALYPEAWMLKVHGGGYQRIGVPDLLICLRGRLIAVEVKHRKPGESLQHLLGRISAVQAAELQSICEADGYAFVAWEVKQVLDVLAAVEEQGAKLDKCATLVTTPNEWRTR